MLPGDTGWAIGAFAQEQEYIGADQKIAIAAPAYVDHPGILYCFQFFFNDV